MPAINRSGLVIRPVSDIVNQFTLNGGATSAAGALDEAILDPSSSADGQSIINVSGGQETANMRLALPVLRSGEYAPSLTIKIRGSLVGGLAQIGPAGGAVWGQSPALNSSNAWSTWVFTPSGGQPTLTAEYLAANQLGLLLLADPGSVIQVAYVSMDAAFKRPIRGLV